MVLGSNRMQKGHSKVLRILVGFKTKEQRASIIARRGDGDTVTHLGKQGSRRNQVLYVQRDRHKRNADPASNCQQGGCTEEEQMNHVLVVEINRAVA